MRKLLDQEMVDAFPLTKSGQQRVTDKGIPERGIGLVLIIGKTAKAYYLLHYVNGKPRTRLLAQTHEMTLLEARAKVRQFLSDPDAFQESVAKGSVQEVAADWFKRRCGHIHTKDHVEHTLKHHLYPRVGSLQFVKLQRPEIKRLLDDIEDKSSAIVADQVLSILNRICKWYAVGSTSYINPNVPGMKRVKRKAKRTRVLVTTGDDGKGINANELVTMWRVADSRFSFGKILQLALLLGHRRANIAGMKWEHIKGETWFCPKEDGQKGVLGRVPLTWLALRIINSQPRTSPYVFPNRLNKNKAFSGFASSRVNFQLALDTYCEEHGLNPITGWVFHDSRRSMRTLLSKLKVDPVTAKLCTGHALQGMDSIYNQDEHEELITEALTKLTDFIAKEVGIERSELKLVAA
jgi:integrase